MNVSHYTAIANEICGPVKIAVKYEFTTGRFRWNFYKNGHIVSSTKVASLVIRIAENLVDVDK